jgi:dienelactone hydrolase
LLAVTTACHDLDAVPPESGGDALSSVVPDVALPVATGSHRVGRRALVWYDAGRERSIPVWIYYPAWVLDSTREPLLGDSLWSALHRDELAPVLGSGPAAGLANLTTTARTNAAIEPSPTPFPVLLFAPARGWLPTDYSGLLEQLASRGFVVVAVAPPGDAAIVRLPDGSVIPTTDASEASHLRTVEDLRFVARILRENATDPGWPLRGMLDLSRVGVFGHGLGGTAAFLAAARDSSFRAAANLDGDFLGTDSDGLPSQPLFYLSTQPAGLENATIDRWAALDRGESRHTQMWNGMRAESRWSLRAQVIGMAGGNFTDAALIPQEVTQSLRGRVTFGAIDGPRGIRLTAGLLENFFAAVFTGSRANFLTASNDFPEARLSY